MSPIEISGNHYFAQNPYHMGGIPEYVLTNDISYLDNLIDNIIYKDIVAYFGIRDVTAVKDVFCLLMERAGKQMSINKISRIIGKSPDTIRRFVDYFIQTYLIFTVERCGKVNERVRAPKKLYAADVGIRNHITGYRNKGAVFENLVYLKIKQRKPCYIYQNGLELDFYFDDTLIEAKFERELEGKQKSFFENHSAHKKISVKGLNDYMLLENFF